MNSVATASPLSDTRERGWLTPLELALLGAIWGASFLFMRVAARDFGARGVGIDLDAKLVQESRESALRAGVSDRVTFIWRDIFDVDLSPATVVTIYLFPEVNARLVPKLMRELRPGSRVVSHEYPLGEWPPERWIQVASTVRKHTLRFWTVPAR